MRIINTNKHTVVYITLCFFLLHMELDDAKNTPVREDGPGCYEPTGYSTFTLIRRPNDDLSEETEAKIYHRTHQSIVTNVFYIKTERIARLRKEIELLETQIKALAIMLKEKTEEDENYEEERLLFVKKHNRLKRVQKKLQKKRGEFDRMWNGAGYARTDARVQK